MSESSVQLNVLAKDLNIPIEFLTGSRHRVQSSDPIPPAEPISPP